jgi:pyocin large subunit-like protein
MNVESLSDRVNRAKARWLKRVMYESSATSTQKCFAYAMADHLNCVTLDCWPAQPTLARILGRKSIKTAHRAARGLASLGLITSRRNTSGKKGYRYAPVFWSEDMDNSVSKNGQRRLKIVDMDVRESSLESVP